MPQDADRRRSSAAPAQGVCLLFLATIVALGGALLAGFVVSYTLLKDSPAQTPGLLREIYGILAAGLLVLAGQAALVFVLLVRPLRQTALRAEQLTQALEQYSHRDLLTGALNRTAFDEMVVRELEALRRYSVVFCGIMLDAEGFRQVNERLGYETGDHVLADLAQLLKSHMRKADYLFRWRSGKFMILATGIEAGQARIFAAKLRDLVAQHTFRQGVSLTAGLGVAQAQPDDSPETFVARVKAALALAREQRSGGVDGADAPA